MSEVSVSELVRRTRERDGRLPFEIGAFVALETTEALLGRPARVGADDVYIQPDGQLRISAGEGVPDEESARGVVAVLSRLLVAAGAGVPPVLLELVETGPHSGRWSLAELRTELEASLVPLNRGAARRVLARLLREGDKRPPRSVRPPQPTDDVDADLDALLEGRDPEPEYLPTAQFQPVDAHGNPVVPFDQVAKKPGQRAVLKKPRPPTAAEAPDTLNDAEKDEIDALLDPLDRATPMVGIEVPAEARRSFDEAMDDAFDATFEAEPTPLPAAPPPSQRPPAKPAPAKSAPAKPAPAASSPTSGGAVGPGALDRELEPRRAAVDLDGFDEPLGKSRKGLGLVVGLLVLLVGGAVAVAVLRPDVLARLTGDAPEEEPVEAPETIVHRPEGGTLRVSAPENAQILYFVGRGPATAEYLPLGVAHEMVVLTDAGATRSVVPADATWDTSGERPRYELAMQVADAEGGADVGETRLSPDAMGTPTGGLGDIRVITNPPGAKVYLLVGFGEAVVEDLPVGEAHELLLTISRFDFNHYENLIQFPGVFRGF